MLNSLLDSADTQPWKVAEQGRAAGRLLLQQPVSWIEVSCHRGTEVGKG